MMMLNKYDSLWKRDFNPKTGRRINRKYKGKYMTAMQYATYTKGGVKMIQAARNKPWSTFTAL